jgi:choline-glycine betaine transporter
MKVSNSIIKSLQEPSSLLIVPLMFIALLLMFGFMKDCANPYWSQETCWDYNSYGNYK